MHFSKPINFKIACFHRRDAKNAKIKAFLAEFAEGAEGKILFVCPEKSSGQTKKLFWRIGLSPILQKKTSLSVLCGFAVKILKRIFLIDFFIRSTYKTLEARGAWLRHKSWVGSGNESK